MIRRTKWFWLSATFPLSCPLSPYLQLLEVLLLHLLLCYNVRLVLNLVYLLRGAVRLNLRHYPGDRRLESRYHNLRGKLRRYLQLLASRQTLLSVGKPACQQATLLCLAGQSRYRGKKKKKKGREIQQNEGWWQTTCYSRWLWWNITIELNEPRQEVSGNKPRDNGYRFSYLKKTKACLFKFGGSALSWRPEARVGVKKKSEKLNCAVAAMGGAEFTRIRLLHSPFTATKEQRYSMQRMAAHSTTVPTELDGGPNADCEKDRYGAIDRHLRLIQRAFTMDSAWFSNAGARGSFKQLQWIWGSKEERNKYFASKGFISDWFTHGKTLGVMMTNERKNKQTQFVH